MRMKSTLLVAAIAATLFLLQPGVSPAQQENLPELTHEMSPEEMLRKDEIGVRFVETPPPTGIIRNIAEFEPMEGVLVARNQSGNFGISYSLIAELSQDCKVWTVIPASAQNVVTTNFTNNGVNLSNVVWVLYQANSYWTRDYGPWFIHYGNTETAIVDFPYNRPRPLDDSIPKVVAAQLGIPWFGMNLIHTGGNYMTLGTGTSASTDLVITENPSLTATQIDQLAEDYLGVTTYHKVPDPNNTYIDHIDCWGKYLAPDKVLIRSVPPSHAQYNAIENTASFFASQTSVYGTPFKIYRVYTPNDQPYTNSLILNKKVFVPVINALQYDTAAIHVYEQAMPGYEVIGFTGSWQSTDALHCRTKGIADRGMLEISHMPVLGYQPLLPQYTLSATITPYSFSGLYLDSVYVSYKVNNGNYLQLPMVSLGNQEYEAAIPAYPTGSLISYYIHAADSSGRSENHPYIGPADPHVFEIGTVGVPGEPVPGSHANVRLSASPNPFRSVCTLTFELDAVLPASLEICDMLGQHVKTLVRQPLGIGKHLFCWDARDENGHQAAPGMYVARLTAGGKTTAVKLILGDR